MASRIQKKGARLRSAIVDEIANEYLATTKQGKTLAFGDGLDIAARAIVNAIDDEKNKPHLLFANEKLGVDLLSGALKFALDALSSYVQSNIDIKREFSGDPSDGLFLSQEQEEPEGFADMP